MYRRKKTNSKGMWKSINLLIGKTSNTTKITSLSYEDEIITGDVNVSQTFNYFSCIGSTLSNRLPNTTLNPLDFGTSTKAAFPFQFILVEDVVKLLETFKHQNQVDLYQQGC